MTQSLLVRTTETTVLCLICLATFIGNASLFVIVYKNRNLRTITNMFILNLAAADILVSALSMPVTMVTIIKERWVFGDTACVALGFLTILSFIASVMSLAMIAISRYYYIVMWKTYRNSFTKRRALIYGAMVWFMSISLASPPLFGWAEYRFIPGKSYCFVYWPSNVYYMFFMITVCFFGPLSVTGFCYYNILSFTRNAKRNVAVSRNNVTPQSLSQEPSANETQIKNSIYSVPELDGGEGRKPEMDTQRNETAITELDINEDNKSKMREFQVTAEEARITNTLLVIVSLFIICWAPFAVTMFFDMYFPKPLPRAVDIISLFLGYLNSVCNPIVYGVSNSTFRRGFLNLYSRFIPQRLRSTNV